MNRDFGRANRRVLRQLANTAWDRELSNELRALDASFNAWKAGQITPHDLSARIHEFHHGPARDLYVLYTRIHPSQLVARAVAHGLLVEDDVPDRLRAELSAAIDYYRNEPRILAEDRDDSEQQIDSQSPAS